MEMRELCNRLNIHCLRYKHMSATHCIHLYFLLPELPKIARPDHSVARMQWHHHETMTQTSHQYSFLTFVLFVRVYPNLFARYLDSHSMSTHRLRTTARRLKLLLRDFADLGGLLGSLMLVECCGYRVLKSDAWHFCFPVSFQPCSQ